LVVVLSAARSLRLISAIFKNRGLVFTCSERIVDEDVVTTGGEVEVEDDDEEEKEEDDDDEDKVEIEVESEIVDVNAGSAY